MMYAEGAMVTDDMPEMEKRDPELPLKEEVCGVFDSSTIYESMQGDWRVSRVDNFEVTMPIMRSEPPLHAADSKDFDRDVVEELTVKSYKRSASDKKNKSPFMGEAAKSRNGQWSHLYQLAGGQHNAISFCGDSLTRARDQMVLNARDSSGRSNADVLENRLSGDKHAQRTDEDGCEMMSSKKTVSGGAPSALNVGVRGLPNSSFTSFFGHRNVKGKEVASGHPMTRNVLDVGQNDHGDKNKHPTPILKQLPQDCTNGLMLDLDQGISLREWLKPGNSPMNKAERLSLLRKIVEVVDNAHSQGFLLLNLWPSSFIFMPSNRVQYLGSSARVAPDGSSPCKISKKRRKEHDTHDFAISGAKQQKVVKDNTRYQQTVERDHNMACVSRLVDGNTFQIMGRQHNSLEANFPSEEKVYICPEQLAHKSCTTSSSNIYCLGLLAFELFCSFDSLDALSVAMLDVHQRIFPPSFLSENPKEAAFIMWLLHPEPSLRPTTREILLSDLICQSEAVALSSSTELPSVGNHHDETDSEILMEFLISLKEKQQEKTSKLVEDIKFLEADIKEAEKRHLLRTSSGNCAANNEGSTTSVNAYDSSNKRETRLAGDLSRLEKAYFSTRTQTTNPEDIVRSHRGLLKHTETVSQSQNESECGNVDQKSNDRLEAFFKGLCKFTRYNKFEVRGSVRNGEFINSTSAICSLSFDRYEDYIAAAGVSRKIKIFDVGALLHESAEVNYPAVEMVNNSKLSCISWNNYIRNYLASTDYDGAVKIWDASVGTVSSQYTEHQKRAWSVDFSQMDPTKLVTGSDDCSVKLWNANDKKSICTLWNQANVCCVQFSPYSSHLLAFGAADYKVYGYDLRHTRIPWCTLSGHRKAVSFVKFMDPETLVSASTDNTLKLWNLSKTGLPGSSSDACSSTLTGHTNEKNFVGLSVRDGYITCGSETNEVFAYHKFMPTPITSHKFGSVDPISGHETKEENNGLFVSSVCWRRKSNMVVAANSSGGIKILELV